MPKKITDESLADPAVELVPDEALADATPADEADAQLEPEDFDLAEWLEGIGPARFKYTLDGRTIELRARTIEWARELNESMPDADEDAKNRAYVAAHIVDERITAGTLASLQEKRPNDFGELLQLLIQIDTRPTSQIQPRFLLGASD